MRMPTTNCLTQYFSTVLGRQAGLHDPEVVPWFIYAPPKALNLGRALAKNHSGGHLELGVVEGSNHTELVEHFDLTNLLATRLPNKNSTPEFELGARLPQRAISSIEASAVRESVRLAARPLTGEHNVWDLPSSGWGSRVVILKYIGGTLSQAKAQPKFSTIYPLFKQHLERGLSVLDATHQARRQLIEGAAYQVPTAVPEGSSAAILRPVPLAAGEPSQEAASRTSPLSGTPVSVPPRRPPAPRAVLTPVGVAVGKSALPARPVAPREPSASVVGPAVADPRDRQVHTPTGSDAEIASSESEARSGIWRDSEARSRSPSRNRLGASSKAPARRGVIRPVAPPSLVPRGYPHSAVRLAQAPITYRR